ncbi:MAG: hypothetical protein AAF598_16460 [Bacteroidota bacterium]
MPKISYYNNLKFDLLNEKGLTWKKFHPSVSAGRIYLLNSTFNKRKQNMKNLCILTLFLLFSGNLIAQETGNDSYTIQRLIIFNDKGELLLQQHPNGWMTPALRHNTEVTTHQALSDLAQTFGLTISTPQLHGIFMYFHSDHKKPSFRQHYSCHLIDGTLKIPEEMLGAQWFAPHEAVKKMLDPDAVIVRAVGEMTQHILEYPNSIWGGSYTLVKAEGKKTISQILENYYPIGKIE